ncbi:hypothetical protein BDA99DRAFT_599939 [Phascolomyces articulosus]|uniref:F-box domain-containing protein n=1 Tax=Phascolomyces articulosus TaxID=60185 RepID=A0AAD5KBJ4_9FUNG|nr:hypothetical protein BDA99DRAFT_599939 [Phascolomyces articulosus]
MAATITNAQFETTPFAALYNDPWTHFTSTELDFATLQNTFHQGKQAYAVQNYKEAIEFYNKALNALHQDLKHTILLHRAVAYEKSKQYQEALDDCAYLEANSDEKRQEQQQPRPDVYWIKASIFLELDNLGKAAYIYKKGFDIISKQTFPEQKELLFNQYECLMKEIRYQNQRLVRRLPHEILFNILSFMSWRTQGQFALTCWFWYKFILQEWPGFGSSIEAVRRSTQLPYEYLTQFLRHVQPRHVKSVQLELCEIRHPGVGNSGIRAWCETIGNPSIVYEHLIEHEWDKIESLNIRPFNNQQLQNILLINSGSIQTLELYHNTSNSNFHHEDGLIDSVRICNNIHTIVDNVEGEISSQYIYMTLAQPNWFPTKLSLSCEVTSSFLSKLLIKAPSLTSLCVCNFYSKNNFIELLRIIYHDAPQLQSLIYSVGKVYKNSLSTTYSRLQDKPSYATVIGLKSFLLVSSSLWKDDEDHTSLDNILELFMKRSHNSLEHLYIENINILTCKKTFTTLVEHGTSNLQELTLVTNTQKVARVPGTLSQLLLRSSLPSLKILNLAWDYLCGSDGLMGKYLNPEVTKIPSGESFGDHTSELLPSTLFGQTKSLQSIRLVSALGASYHSTERLIDMVTCIGICESLTTVDLKYMRLKNDLFMKFLESIKNSNINTLRINTPSDPMDEEELKSLASLSNLEYLKLYDFKKDVNECFGKPKLFWLFQEYQGNRRPLFIIYRCPIFTVKGWTGFLSTSKNHLVRDGNNTECLHEKYSIKESSKFSRTSYGYDLDCVDEDFRACCLFFDAPFIRRTEVEDLYEWVRCTTCRQDHIQQRGYDDVNEIYEYSQN